MMAGDETYGDDVTSGADDPPGNDCPWCEDYNAGLDPEPCPDHPKAVPE